MTTQFLRAPDFMHFLYDIEFLPDLEHIIVTSFAERVNHEELEQADKFRELSALSGIPLHNIKLILDDSAGVRDLDIPVEYMYFPAHAVVAAYNQNKYNIPFTAFNKKSPEALALLGKTTRPRIEFLINVFQNHYGFYQKLRYSFMLRDQALFRDVCNTLNLSNDVSDLLLSCLPRYIDLKQDTIYQKENPPEVTSHYIGYPFDPRLYNNTFMSVVMETISNMDLVSEKTWRPIQNGHPFVVYAGPNWQSYMENNGIDTFSDIVTHITDEPDTSKYAVACEEAFDAFKATSGLDKRVLDNARVAKELVNKYRKELEAFTNIPLDQVLHNVVYRNLGDNH